MITNEEMLEAVADAVRVRRRTPKGIYPHPFECSLLQIDTEDLTMSIEVMDGEVKKTFIMALQAVQTE